MSRQTYCDPNASSIDVQKGQFLRHWTHTVCMLIVTPPHICFASPPHLCCIVDGYFCCVVDRHRFFFLQDCAMYCMQVISSFRHAESAPFCKSYYLFTLLFLSKQTRHWRNVVFFCFFWFISGRASRASDVWVDVLTSSCLVIQLQSAEVSRTVTSICE